MKRSQYRPILTYMYISPQMRKSSITSIQSDSSISSIGSGMLNAMDFDEKFLAMLQSNCKGGGTQEVPYYY